ncbi:hypothetical protein GCM10022222_79290 [Amycolatopsis ultiminotia]|uniref:Uncharacterized protein n=1 Tax=Amycolatopsis ultiminotia TaxID=543629 RepID=A0ABP6YFH7_9PSEU
MEPDRGRPPPTPIRPHAVWEMVKRGEVRRAVVPGGRSRPAVTARPECPLWTVPDPVHVPLGAVVVVDGAWFGAAVIVVPPHVLVHRWTVVGTRQVRAASVAWINGSTGGVGRSGRARSRAECAALCR